MFKLREDNDVLTYAAELHLMSTTDDGVQETTHVFSVVAIA